jgi:hypothetical protein
MTIHCNKNITKQLNSYSYVIAITLRCLLQRTTRALRVRQKTFIPTSGYICDTHFLILFYFFLSLI